VATPDSARPLTATTALIRRFHDGETAARDELVARCLPALRRWAHGRLPAWGRDLSETEDLVQVALMRAVGGLDRFRPERQGAFLAYLRQILMNALRDELRRSQRQPHTAMEEESLEAAAAPNPSAAPEDLMTYEKALEGLADRQRQAVVLRLEFGMTFPEVAAELELPSANAARMLVSRGLLKIAEATTWTTTPKTSAGRSRREDPTD
jgi:RNA polymerase sigma-70 factor, ECF subfamily